MSYLEHNLAVLVFLQFGSAGSDKFALYSTFHINSIKQVVHSFFKLLRDLFGKGEFVILYYFSEETNTHKNINIVLSLILRVFALTYCIKEVVHEIHKPLK